MASPAPEDSPPPPPPSPSTSSNSTPPPPPSPSTSSNSPPPPSTSSNSPPPSSPPPPSPTSSSPPPSPPPPTSKGNGDNNNSSPPPPPPPPASTPSPPSSNRPSLPSPPPPRSVGPPPPRDSHSRSPATITNSNSDMGGGSSSFDVVPVVVGVVVGVVVLFILGLVGCLCTCRKKKKTSPHYDYYPDHFNPGSKAVARGEYYNSSTPNGVWQQTGSSHHSPVGIPPPPGGMAGGHVGGWSSPSPIGLNNSSDMSSNNYSGPQGPALPPPHPSVALGFTKSSFTYDELALATSGFSQANLLGQGGFGYVHKGVLPNGKEIAVKSLKAGSGQGDREFQAEVEIISRVHHRHLVSLVGFSIAGGQKLLVYEFLPNNTLEYHLHGKGLPVMEWSNRMKIAMGSAKGLAYLHEDCHPRIIHRDIKGANILLDYSFEAKVADFGLAKLSNDTNTHVSTRVMGTFGYLAPEYAASGKLTDKSDVFSFGVMLLELITGRRPIDLNSDEDDNLVDWARPLCDHALEDGNYSKLVDPLLEGNYDPQEMMRMVACAGASVRHSARRRPKMSQIVRALEGDLSVEHMKNGMTSNQSGVFSSSDYGSNSYDANMRNFRKMALESTEYASSEFGQTSEYGLNPSCSSSEDMSGRAASRP